MAQGQVAWHRSISLHGIFIPLRIASWATSIIRQRFLQIIFSIEDLDETLGSMDKPQRGWVGVHAQHPDILESGAINDNNKEKRRQWQKQASIIDVKKYKYESEWYPTVDLVTEAEIQVRFDGIDETEEIDG